MEVCMICNKEFKSSISLSLHIKKDHCSIQEYYDTYILEDKSLKFCPICGEENIFYKWYRNGRSAYSKTCCKTECRYKQVENTVMENFGCKNVFQSEIIKEQIKYDRFERTGYEYSSQLPEVKEAKEIHFLKKYNVINPFQAEECKKKAKETMMKNYGVEHALQSPDIRKKYEETSLGRYGAFHFMLTSEGKGYLKNIFLEKYGVNTPSKLPECKEKARETSLHVWGFPYPMQNKELYEKAVLSYFNKTGYRSPFQNPEVQNKGKQTKLDLYGDENYRNREQAENTYFEKTGYKNPLQNPECREKGKDTYFTSTGYYHNSQNPMVQENKIITSLIKYGTEYPCQSTVVKDKIKDTSMKIYGFESANSSPMVQAKKEETILARYGVKYIFCISNKPYSKISQELFWSIYEKLPKDMQNHCHFAELNKEFGKYDSINNKGYFYDFVITNIKFCIEFNGNYWHADPDKYTDSDTIHGQLSKDIWEKDKNKIGFLENLGYSVFVIWENLYNQNKNDVINICLTHINNIVKRGNNENK